MMTNDEKWAVTGNSYAALEATLQEITDATTSVKIPATALTLWTQREDGRFYSHREKKRTSITEEGSKTLFEFQGKLHQLASIAIGALGLRVGLSGSGLQHCSWYRDAFLSELLQDLKEKITIIMRDEKVYGVFSNRYTYIPQDRLMRLIERSEKELGEADIQFWADQFNTRIWCRFPDKADELSAMYSLPEIMVPGIMITTSDTSDSSIMIQETWDNDHGNFVYGHQVSRKHMGAVRLDALEEMMVKNIFGQYTYVPEKLMDFLGIDIEDVDTEHILKKIGADKILGSKRTKELSQQLDLELRSLPLTAYGVVTRMMTIPDRVSGFSDLQLQMLREALFKLFEYEFDKEEKVVLM